MHVPTSPLTVPCVLAGGVQLSVVEGKLAEMKAEVGIHGAPTEYKKGKLLACTFRLVGGVVAVPWGPLAG